MHVVCSCPDKFATENIELLRQTFFVASFGLTHVFEWHAYFKARRVSIENDGRSEDHLSAKHQKMGKSGLSSVSQISLIVRMLWSHLKDPSLVTFQLILV